MNLISCGNCGVVLDKDRLEFPDIENEDGSINFSNAVWATLGYTAAVPCPACGAPILEQEDLV